MQIIKKLLAKGGGGGEIKIRRNKFGKLNFLDYRDFCMSCFPLSPPLDKCISPPSTLDGLKNSYFTDFLLTKVSNKNVSPFYTTVKIFIILLIVK